MSKHVENIVKRPLFKATGDLTAQYVFTPSDDNVVKTYVPALDTHAQLKAAENGYREKYSSLYDSKTAKSSLNATNIVAATMTLLYADTPTEEGYIGEVLKKTIPLRVPIQTPQYTFNTPDFFSKDQDYNINLLKNKGKRNHTFNAHIKQRLGLFETCMGYRVDIHSKNFFTYIDKANFHETFHHSEQAVMEFLSAPDGIKLIAGTLQDFKAETYLGTVLDMYSTRYLCEQCNVNLIGFQNTHENGFLHDLKKKVESSGFRINTPKNEVLLWSTRVSGSQSGKGTHDSSTKMVKKDNTPCETITPKDSYLILQGDSTVLGLDNVIEKEKYSLDTFSGDFFTSREIGKTKMEQSLGNRKCFQK